MGVACIVRAGCETRPAAVDSALAVVVLGAVVAGGLEAGRLKDHHVIHTPVAAPAKQQRLNTNMQNARESDIHVHACIENGGQMCGACESCSRTVLCYM